jgi:hypothetical protein
MPHALWPLVLMLVSPAIAGEVIEAFGLQWDVPTAADWRVGSAPGPPTLDLLVPRPSTQPRRPAQYALARTAPYKKLELEVEVKKEPLEARKRRTSVMLVYAWRGPDHFNYAYLSVDAAREQPVHNGIFHVYGGDRVRISAEEGPGSLKGEEWHKVRLLYDAGTGKVEVWVNGESSLSLRAVDWSLGAGCFGIGSFFDLGSFRNLRYRGEKAK